MSRGMEYMRGRLIEQWIDEQGHWCGNTVEAPHYAMLLRRLSGSLDHG